MEKPWNKVNFGSGKIVFLDEMQKEDMLQVEYPNQFLLDMGWYQNKYIIQVIQNDDWEHPIKQYRTKEKQQLQVLLEKAVQYMEQVVKLETEMEVYGGEPVVIGERK